MTVAIKHIETPEYVMNEDGEFRCLHENVEVEPPCCSGRDCGCYGMYSVYCPDCDNEDLTEVEAQAIIDSYNEPPEDDCYE